MHSILLQEILFVILLFSLSKNHRTFFLGAALHIKKKWSWFGQCYDGWCDYLVCIRFIYLFNVCRFDYLHFRSLFIFQKCTNLHWIWPLIFFPDFGYSISPHEASLCPVCAFVGSEAWIALTCTERYSKVVDCCQRRFQLWKYIINSFKCNFIPIRITQEYLVFGCSFSIEIIFVCFLCVVRNFARSLCDTGYTNTTARAFEYNNTNI